MLDRMEDEMDNLASKQASRYLTFKNRGNISCSIFTY